MTKYTLAEWHAEATRRFGKEASGWKFVCPSCGHVASIMDWRDAGAEAGAVAFSCIGRYLKKKAKEAFRKGRGPCNYAGGGLIRLNPVKVITPEGTEHEVFDFALQESA